MLIIHGGLRAGLPLCGTVESLECTAEKLDSSSTCMILFEAGYGGSHESNCITTNHSLNSQARWRVVVSLAEEGDSVSFSLKWAGVRQWLVELP